MIDFRQAELRDVSWWRRTRLIITSMARDEELESLRDTFSHQLALVGHGNLLPEDFKTAQKQAKEILTSILNSRHPWDTKDAAAIPEDTIAGLIEAYRAQVADTRDPAVVQRMKDKLANAVEVETESPEDRLDRLIRERDAKLGKT